MNPVPPPNPNRGQEQPEEKKHVAKLNVSPFTEIAVIAKEGLSLVVSSVSSALKATPPTIKKVYSTLQQTVEELKEAIEERLEVPPKEALPPEREGEFIEVNPDEFIRVRQKKKEE